MEVDETCVDVPEPLLVEPVEGQGEKLQQVYYEATHDETEYKQENGDLSLLDPSKNHHQNTVTHVDSAEMQNKVLRPPIRADSPRVITFAESANWVRSLAMRSSMRRVVKP